MKKRRVRYAPSPTGYLHIGNARTALFNYLYAKHYDGEFIIRIEDTDIKRNKADGVKSQLENLKWLGISWDEGIDINGEYGPYNQLARFEQQIYQQYIDYLLEHDLAYYCFCSSEELDAESEAQKQRGEIPKYSGKCRHLTKEEVASNLANNISYSIRFKVPENKTITWDDMVKGTINFNSNDVSGDFNIVKRDGIPTYNFAVVIDDHLMEISHVLRGEDHISNTPKQILLYQALNFEIPTFGHMSLIVNENGKKLSKRDHDIIQYIEEYRELGYLPEAMFNFIALLGWSPEGEAEIFSQKELINIFDEKRLSKSSAKFDVKKLAWINNTYIKNMDDNQYLTFINPFLAQCNVNCTKEQLEQLALMFKPQISYGAEIIDLIQAFFNFDLEADALNFINENDSIKLINTFKNELALLNEINHELISNLIKNVGKMTDCKGKMLYMPLRIYITGKMHGPELPDIITLLGKEQVLMLIDKHLQ